ncbi:MAG: hypothetical protein HWE16_12960 [Gammaproteobacteria bacterium]|nr:hypothetical protein [Gammaproteobacteria bacterium]
MGNLFSARDSAELANLLIDADTHVPKRAEGRTKQHVEYYAITHLLSALLNTNHLSYPLELVQRERPDFLLKINGYEVGIEHTEAIPQNEAHKAVLRDTVDSSSDTYFISRHKPNEPKKSSKKLIEEIHNNLPSSGWLGDSVEQDWAEAIFYFVQRKINSLKKTGFDKFAQNWLLIYDNWPLPSIEYEISSQFLHKKLLNINCFESFNNVFVLSGKCIYEFSSNSYMKREIATIDSIAL